MRKLATIREISDIQPIPKRDKIVLASVDGWKIIVKKDEFQIGDKCVYCEIDSVLPKREEFKFLESKQYRIKTMKMSGVISQGICFPLSILPDGVYAIGDDVTEILGITKFVPKSSEELLPKRSFFNRGKSKQFPSFIPKTDEPRVQNMTWILNYAKINPQLEWKAHEKLDGTSATFLCIRRKKFFIFDDFEFIVCSRNFRIFEDEITSMPHWRVVEKYDIKNKLIKHLKYNKDLKYVCIQGEIIDKKVQGNKYKVNEPKFYLFNLRDSKNELCSFFKTDNFCKLYDLDRVPEIEGFNLSDFTMESLLKFSDGKSKLANVPREGIVVRSDGRDSFKVISNEFLLKYGE